MNLYCNHLRLHKYEKFNIVNSFQIKENCESKT